MRFKALWSGLMAASLVFTAGAAAAQPAVKSSEAPSKGGQTRLILLGTGAGPIMRKDRSQPASLLIVRGKPYLIDSGDGVVRQLTLANYHAADLHQVFLTHLHYDHTAGLGYLVASSWISPHPSKIDVYGPPGTQALVEAAVGAFAIPETIFETSMQRHVTMRDLGQGHDRDVTKPQEIYRDENLRVIAVENSHYNTKPMTPQAYGTTKSYSYRFETPDKVIVFTGDTGPSDAVAELAKGADILVSEVIDSEAVVGQLREQGTATPSAVAHMEHEHLIPEAVGAIATKAGVKLLVLSHIATPPGLESPVEPLAVAVRRYFHGRVVAGNDLQEF
jgi:ribonuclease BN (tRNA processing enzyme)